MASLNTPIPREELETLAEEAYTDLKSNLSNSIPERSSTQLRNLKTSAFSYADVLKAQIGQILADSPKKISSSEELALICQSIHNVIKVAMADLQDLQPETSGRGGHGRKQNRMYDQTAGLFKSALRRARSKLNDKYNLSDEVSAVSATRSPDQGTEARG